MPRKTGQTLKGRQTNARENSWACVGVDTSMSSIAMVAKGYDAMVNKRFGPVHLTKRWVEEDYFTRLKQAAKSDGMMQDVLASSFLMKLDRVFIAIEEPWYYGAVKNQESAWLKQQAEICGVVKAALLRYGYENVFEINNAQWYKTIRDDGAKVRRGLLGKMDVKKWAIVRQGMPDLPDLVKSKTGSKIPRPAEGYGAKAQPIQPEDVYDAAAMCEWMRLDAIRLGLIQDSVTIL